MLKNNKGFSLIELMVVVAIIAILSTIAIPSYNSFQAKARQKEGFAMLSAYFTAAQATRAEFGFFPGNFVETGFQPVGQLRYQVVAADNATEQVPYGTRGPTCISTATATCVCDPVCLPLYNSVWTHVPGVVGGAVGAVAPTGCTASATSAAFLVCTGGVVKSGGDADVYSMNHLKALVMVADGLN